MDLYSQCNSKETPATLLIENVKLRLKCIWKGKGTRIVQRILKKNKVRRLILPDVKTNF